MAYEVLRQFQANTQERMTRLATAIIGDLNEAP